MITSKALTLIGAAVAQGGGAVMAQAEGMNHFITGGLSIGSLVTAIGAIFVMREKVRRNESDIASHKEETTTALSAVTATFKEEMKSMREDHRDDQRETREALRTLTTSISDIRELVARRAQARRAHD